jgi:death-on-curing protein
MSFNPDFLTIEDVLEIHSLQIKNYGGAFGIRDKTLLESAVMTPQATFDGDYLHSCLFEMAAAYAFHIAENQPFIDGNKRTALASSLVFLEINGYSVTDPQGILYDSLINLSNKSLDKMGFAKILETLKIKNEFSFLS